MKKIFNSIKINKIISGSWTLIWLGPSIMYTLSLCMTNFVPLREKTKKLIFHFFIIFSITGVIVKYLNINMNKQIDNGILIDSLFTTATITLVALNDFAASSSGSAQFQKKMSGGEFEIDDDDGLRDSFNRVNIATHDLSTASIWSLIFFSIFLTVFGFMIKALPKEFDMFIGIYGYSSGIQSGIILLILLLRYMIFSSNTYRFSAKIFGSHIENLYNEAFTNVENKSNSIGKFRSLMRTNINLLHGTKNVSLLFEIFEQDSKIPISLSLHTSGDEGKNDHKREFESFLKRKMLYFIFEITTISKLNKIRLLVMLAKKQSVDLKNEVTYIKYEEYYLEYFGNYKSHEEVCKSNCNDCFHCKNMICEKEFEILAKSVIEEQQHFTK